MAGPLTPAAGATPYCAPAEFVAFADAGLVGQLVRDDGVQLNVAGLLADPVLAAHLAAASGELEAACVRGGRYAPADLAALGGNGHALLARLVAALAFGTLLERRGYPDGVPAAVAAARATLASVADGVAALPFVEVERAGLPTHRFRTALEILRAGLYADSYQGCRFLGPPTGGAYTRQNGFPGGSGGGYGGGYGGPGC